MFEARSDISTVKLSLQTNYNIRKAESKMNLIIYFLLVGGLSVTIVSNLKLLIRQILETNDIFDTF